ncbi:hypothetical protein GCM10028806_24610 [Spirosoma terrae]
MKTLLATSIKIGLLNFLFSAFCTLIAYFLDKSDLHIQGLSLFLLLLGIVFFVVSVRKLGGNYTHRFDSIVFITSLSTVTFSLLGFGFSLFMHGYIDPNLRFEIAHASAISFYESIQQIEREQNVAFFFDYDEEVKRIASDFEPMNMLYTKVRSTFIVLVLYNFLVMLTNHGRSEDNSWS